MAGNAPRDALAMAICEALDIPTTKLRRMELHFEVGTAPTLIAEKWIFDEEYPKELKTILERYKVVPIGDEEEVKLAEWNGIYPPITETGKPGTQPARFVVYARHEEEAEHGSDS